MKKSGLNSVEVKEYNRALITQLICTGSETTRHELARESNLSSMTVTNIIGELISKNIIIESDVPKELRLVGRNPKIISISPTSPVVAGIWISKDFIIGVICDLALNLITAKRIEFTKNENSDTILKQVANLAGYLLNFSTRKVIGLGIAVIGVIDTIEGSVKNVTNFFNSRELHIKEYLETKFDTPIYVKNDMQSSALCEMYFGIGRDIENFMYVGITNGVGSAIVSNRHLFNNSTGSCGELGHMSIDYKGAECTCGSRGCLELYVSVPLIIERINKECNCNLNDFEDAMKYCMNSKEAYNILVDISESLTYALNNLINIVDISTVIFGHSAVFIPNEIIDNITEKINKISIFKNSRNISIKKSKFLDNSPMFGSACIVLDQVFKGKLSI